MIIKYRNSYEPKLSDYCNGTIVIDSEKGVAYIFDIDGNYIALQLFRPEEE